MDKSLSSEELNIFSKFLKNKDVLVTGGFGFIGGHLSKKLVEIGAKVTVVDIDTNEERPSIINDPFLHLREQITIREGCINNISFIKEICSEKLYYAVFNLAASASTIEKALVDPLSTFMTNSMGIVVLLNALHSCGQKPTVVFHASTDKVYGELEDEAYDEEISPLKGRGLYDSSKLAADVFARVYYDVFNMPTVVLRMCNIFGPYDFNTEYRLIPKSLKALFELPEPQPPILYSESRSHSRDFLYIDDVVRSILLLSYFPKCRGQVFNSMGCIHVTTTEMMNKLLHCAESYERIHNPSRADKIKQNYMLIQRPSENSKAITIKQQHLNAVKLQNYTNFQPLFSIEEGLHETVAFYRDYFNHLLQQKTQHKRATDCLQ